MKGIILIALFGVGAVAIYKHHLSLATATQPGGGASGDLVSGVSVYPNVAAAQRPQQILAALPTNSEAVSEFGYSPAFGDEENQPGPGETLY